MDNTYICDVVIAGAGPTGLTLANLLCRLGITVVVVERNASTVKAPRAVSIDDESLRTMQAIGLIDEVMQNVAADYGSPLLHRAGKTVCEGRANNAGVWFSATERIYPNPSWSGRCLQGFVDMPMRSCSSSITGGIVDGD